MNAVVTTEDKYHQQNFISLAWLGTLLHRVKTIGSQRDTIIIKGRNVS